MPPNERGRPGQEAASEVELPGDGVDGAIVGDDSAETWAIVRAGWIRAGDAMPRVGSLAWLALPADDPVRAAASAARKLDAETDLMRHGPAIARALATVTE